MRKTAYFVLLFVTLLLTACNVEDVGTTSTNSDNSNNTGKNEIVKTNDTETDFEIYRQQIAPLIADVQTHLENIVIVTDGVSENPLVLVNSEYTSLVNEVSNAFFDTIQEVRNVDAGNNPEIIEIHDLILKSMDKFEYVSINFPIAVENFDVELLEEVTINMGNGGRLMQEATIKIETLKSTF